MTVFDRLYKSHTASSAAKRQPAAHAVDAFSATSSSSSSTTPSRATYKASPHTTSAQKQKPATALQQKQPPTSPTTRAVVATPTSALGRQIPGSPTGGEVASDEKAEEDEDEEEDDDDDDAENSRVVITVRERDKTFEKVYDSHSLGLSPGWFRKDKGSYRCSARALMEALFAKDFRRGDKLDRGEKSHWDIEPAEAQEIETDTPNRPNSAVSSFKVEKSATWDWKDIYAVAQAKAVVHFLDTSKAGGDDDLDDTLSVRVTDYWYYVSG